MGEKPQQKVGSLGILLYTRPHSRLSPLPVISASHLIKLQFLFSSQPLPLPFKPESLAPIFNIWVK